MLHETGLEEIPKMNFSNCFGYNLFCSIFVLIMKCLTYRAHSHDDTRTGELQDTTSRVLQGCAKDRTGV